MLAGPETDQLRHMDPLNAWWVTVLLLFVLVVIAITNVSSPRKWRLLAQAMFRMRLGRTTLREEIDLRDRTLVGLLIAAVCVLGMFAWQAASRTGFPDAPSYPVWAGMVAGLVLLHSVLIIIIGAIMRVDNGLLEYMFTGLLIFILAGMVLLPVVALVAYRPEWRGHLLLSGGVLLGLLLIYRWVRGAWIGWGEGVPGRYIIIYLCTAEIVPLLLLIDILRQPLPSLFHQ